MQRSAFDRFSQSLNCSFEVLMSQSVNVWSLCLVLRLLLRTASLLLVLGRTRGVVKAVPSRGPRVTGSAVAAEELSRDSTTFTDCDINTSNEQFNDWLNRSKADLCMLSLRRLGCLPVRRRAVVQHCVWSRWHRQRRLNAYGLVRSCERSSEVFSCDPSTEIEAERDSEPGKILHETREGEMARIGEVPFSPVLWQC